MPFLTCGGGDQLLTFLTVKLHLSSLFLPLCDNHLVCLCPPIVFFFSCKDTSPVALEHPNDLILI